jgi:hypothetical protein
MQYIPVGDDLMRRATVAGRKSETVTVRLSPSVKEGLRRVAHREHRSIANMMEVMIRDYCGRQGIELPDNQPTSQDPENS